MKISTAYVFTHGPDLPAPFPAQKYMGFATAAYAGVSPKLTVQGSVLDIRMQGRALGGADLEPFLKLTFTESSGTGDRVPRPVTVCFRPGDSALVQAKQLETVLKQHSLSFAVSRKGATVTVTQFPTMRAGM